MQEVLMYITVILAIAFLVKKFFFKPKDKKGCSTDCGC
ncbi:FeoB-associated Cys-rich membrane protein [Tenacibaculum sp. K20-16]|nr:FeoB-associated Cys-rich membrane protein [Tenacibaculum sp. 1_MG-2023]MCH3881520.1 FeoB-associated Cys-rich membrane protein [Tenacibaculum aquimarinum]MCH3883588.1 FeoB-associated Cys-rich membrane protein [Tenacibaculum aquimarinum]MDO6598885.1 FeoB-associated Cys-rich membrane protein [Tenacibaculum sp. 1_MG-2023]